MAQIKCLRRFVCLLLLLFVTGACHGSSLPAKLVASRKVHGMVVAGVVIGGSMWVRRELARSGLAISKEPHFSFQVPSDDYLLGLLSAAAAAVPTCSTPGLSQKLLDDPEALPTEQKKRKGRKRRRKAPKTEWLSEKVLLGSGPELYHKCALALLQFGTLVEVENASIVTDEDIVDGEPPSAAILTKVGVLWHVCPLKVTFRSTDRASPGVAESSWNDAEDTDGGEDTEEKGSRQEEIEPRQANERGELSTAGAASAHSSEGKDKSARAQKDARKAAETGGKPETPVSSATAEEGATARRFVTAVGLSTVPGSGWVGEWAMRVVFEQNSNQVFFEVGLLTEAGGTGGAANTSAAALSAQKRLLARMAAGMVARAKKDEQMLAARRRQRQRLSAAAGAAEQKRRALQRDRKLHPEKYERKHRWKPDNIDKYYNNRPARWDAERRNREGMRQP